MTDVSRLELEADLAEEFDLEALAVYADLLQADGDPRGELIALDLAGSDADREELLARWLGAELAAQVETELGFVVGVDLDSDERLDALLAHPAGRYVRGATIIGPQSWVAHAAARLTAHTGRWLAQLGLHVRGWGPMANKEVAIFMTAAPRLERLDVSGMGVLGEVGHPYVKALRVTGGDAIRSMLYSGPARFPSVVALDFAFDSDTIDPKRSFLERLPALRRLDLSRNEPGDGIPPNNFGRRSDAVHALGLQVGRERLTHLRVPSIRTRAAAEQLDRTVAALPNLRAVEVARAYRQFPAAFLPAIAKAPAERWPWPPPDLAARQIAVHVGTEPLPIVGLIVWLEAVFDGLPAPARDAWRAVFEFLDGYYRGDLDVPSKLWREALVGLDDTDELAPWRALRDELERHDVEVRVRNLRG